VGDGLLDAFAVQGENGFGRFATCLVLPFTFAIKGDAEVIALPPIGVSDREADFAVLLHATQHLQGRQQLAVALR
jgi:hypothetical protein